MRPKGMRDASWLASGMRQTLEVRRALPRPYQRPVRSMGQRSLLENLYYAFSVHGVELCDRHAASVGIELRHPLRAAQFVQYAFSTPERLLLRGDQQKYIHCQAMQGILPAAVLARRSKADFSGVFSRQLKGMQELLTETLPRERAGWLSREGMARLYRLYQDNPRDSWYNWALWNAFGVDRVFAE